MRASWKLIIMNETGKRINRAGCQVVHGLTQGRAIIDELDTKTPGLFKPDEPRHEKTGFLHMRKQRRRSASR